MPLSTLLANLPVSLVSVSARQLCLITTRLRTLLCLVLTGVLLSCSTEEPIATSGSGDSGGSAQSNEIGIQLRAVSTQSWLVTGGDVLVEVVFAAPLNRTQLTISLNGRDISDRFTRTAATTLQALLTDLPQGDSTLLVEHSPQRLSESA